MKITDDTTVGELRAMIGTTLWTVMGESLVEVRVHGFHYSNNELFLDVRHGSNVPRIECRKCHVDRAEAITAFNAHLDSLRLE